MKVLFGCSPVRWGDLVYCPLRENLEILMPARNNRTRSDHGITVIQVVPLYKLILEPWNICQRYLGYHSTNPSANIKR
jgi:hypothetical protein